ncbi:GNAT family N-acetyltransferase [Sansalvadorimonas verongulae]|uniref:GNAT family N-acetyltransferase n=1 Tax=Sansalvadorimonas verongulae TaxID=2172824 RepID=UPI0012BBA435|nr:N-acetyltransferase [Sansalvadorimonas verongulae]MTI14692.1 N-acetyltransferase [Sansalvadorimonas verongulae]
MQIRLEQPSDIEAIRTLQYAAFKNHPHHEPGAEPTEHLIVDKLRDAGALTLSLVVEVNGELVGHLAFSPVNVGEKSQGWYGLGPVGVKPSEQSRSIGSALINEAHKRMKELGAQGLVVMGDPAYYQRFGYQQMEAINFPGIPAEYFMAQPLSDEVPAGDVQYHAAFS